MDALPFISGSKNTAKGISRGINLALDKIENQSRKVLMESPEYVTISNIEQHIPETIGNVVSKAMPKQVTNPSRILTQGNRYATHGIDYSDMQKIIDKNWEGHPYPSIAIREKGTTPIYRYGEDGVTFFDSPDVMYKGNIWKGDGDTPSLRNIDTRNKSFEQISKELKDLKQKAIPITNKLSVSEMYNSHIPNEGYFELEYDGVHPFNWRYGLINSSIPNKEAVTKFLRENKIPFSEYSGETQIAIEQLLREHPELYFSYGGLLHKYPDGGDIEDLIQNNKQLSPKRISKLRERYNKDFPKLQYYIDDKGNVIHERNSF